MCPCHRLFFPHNVFLTSVVGLSQDSRQLRVCGYPEQALCLDVVGLAEKSRRLTQDSRETLLTSQIDRQRLISSKSTSATNIGGVYGRNQASVVKVDGWRYEKLLDGHVHCEAAERVYMDNLLLELGRHYSPKDLDEDADPTSFVHDIEPLQSFSYGSAEHMICLQVPAHPRAGLLLRSGAIRLASGEEDDLVVFSRQQLLLAGESGQYVGQECVVVDFKGIGKRGSIENIDRESIL